MLKTAECVSPKHPDKMCDQISDAILDWCLKEDPKARVAVEVMGGHGDVKVIGEVSGRLRLTQEIVEQIVYRITGDSTLDVNALIVEQSSEIANGVDTGGAGDQGIMVGYASNENDEMVPQELYLARSLCKTIFLKHPYDGKTQVTLDMSNKIISIVASFQNIEKAILEEVVKRWAEVMGVWNDEIVIHANPAGDWSKGGFEADTGLTGRKIIVDAYGPRIPVGGGAFSGKDPSKVDRSAAYMARKIAVDLLKKYDALAVVVRLAYAIGVAQPVMAMADVVTKEGALRQMNVSEVGEYDLTPNGIREFLKLDHSIYEETAKWGHFGDKGFTWNVPMEYEVKDEKKEEAKVQ